MDITPQLKRLGLSDKEVKVYLALLEHGPAPAQRIARKANLVRATTYVVLNTLIERGLVERQVVDSHTAFIAESPEMLLKYIEKEEQTLQQMHAEISQLLPQLQAMAKKTDEQPWVEYYEGLDGLRIMRQKMVLQSRFQETWRAFAPVDHLHAVFGEDEYLYVKQRRAKGLRSKIIFTTRSPELKRQLLAEAPSHFAERKFVPPDHFPSDCGMTIYGAHVAIGKFTGEIGGIIINSVSVATMMKDFFNLLWKNLPAASQARSTAPATAAAPARVIKK